jgi:hypothetical protein
MRILVLLYLFVFPGCGSLWPDIAGTYRQSQHWEFNTQLHLKANSHYTYKQRVGNIWLISSGQWQVNQDTLFLKDTLDNNIPELKKQSYLIKRSKLVELSDSLTKPLTLARQK